MQRPAAELPDFRQKRGIPDPVSWPDAARQVAKLSVLHWQMLPAACADAPCCVGPHPCRQRFLQRFLRWFAPQSVSPRNSKKKAKLPEGMTI